MGNLLPYQRKRYPFVFMDGVLFHIRETREDQQIHVILSFDGRLDFMRLRRALRLCLDAEPILGCRLIYHPIAPWWESREDPDNPETCRLVRTADSEESVDAFLTAPLDPFADPLVQVRVFRKHEDAGDILVVKICHLIMDGAGGNEFLRLLAANYNRLNVEPDFEPAVNLTGTRSLRQVSRQFTLLERAKILRRTLRDLKQSSIYLLDKFRVPKDSMSAHPRPAWGLPLTDGGREDRAFVLRRIPAHLAKRCEGYARSHGATLNDVMLTAFYRAMHEQFAPRPRKSMRIRTIANLRRYLPGREGEALCNLCAYVPVNLGYHLGAGFLETLLRVRDRMLAHKADFIGLGVFPMSIGWKYLPFCLRIKISRLELAGMARGIVRPAPKFSNVGDMAAEKLQFDGIKVTDAYQVGTIGYGPAFTVGVTGFEGSLTLSIGICNASRNGPIFSRLFDGMEREILTALEQSVRSAAKPATTVRTGASGRSSV
ncbi:MAG: condensation domain-containing protein [Desulfobacteraceae bacterium]|nr:condensation domain-containing protein [Desulfobacteraceae bacterium]